MEENELTVDDLVEKLINLQRHGYGDMKIRVGDHFLHSDEIGNNYYQNYIHIHPYSYHDPCQQAASNFASEVEKLYSEMRHKIQEEMR